MRPAVGSRLHGPVNGGQQSSRTFRDGSRLLYASNPVTWQLMVTQVRLPSGVRSRRPRHSTPRVRDASPWRRLLYWRHLLDWCCLLDWLGYLSDRLRHLCDARLPCSSGGPTLPERTGFGGRGAQRRGQDGRRKQSQQSSRSHWLAPICLRNTCDVTRDYSQTCTKWRPIRLATPGQFKRSTERGRAFLTLIWNTQRPSQKHDKVNR